MKKIWIDFNEPDRSKFRITKDEINFFNLAVKEEIIFYSEDIQVNAIVGYDSEHDQWFGELITDIIRISEEVAEAREDGFENGKYFGQWTERNNIIRMMKKFNLTGDLIIQITNISKEELNRI
ncbi:hypothetical protein E0485_05745 [Paenibacillus albiflavus]|uniref:Uncharacterized protein n=1 Tax=Paenibacillus albiflavus TaxID=2545760 RepID=A0A4R4EIY7_9BACL|nr:hypothetical protein [Paenibacillus albiflavus]TCZ79363.1 hypothetical protein E0485_05745 [Paenibacillus albiflavus]